MFRLGFARARIPAVALVAGALAIGSVSCASAGKLTAYLKMHNSFVLAHPGDVFAIGVQLVDFMHRIGLQDGALRAFWFDASRDPSLISLSSLLPLRLRARQRQMPIPAPELRARLEALGEKLVVLLCSELACGRGGASLRHAGYDSGLVAAERLHAGSKSVWVEAYHFGASASGERRPQPGPG